MGKFTLGTDLNNTEKDLFSNLSGIGRYVYSYFYVMYIMIALQEVILI